ncbi:MAG: CZB domain-containing protein [Methylomonas sp.]
MPLDIQQCRFGLWLNTEGLARIGAQPHFQDIDLLHRQVHALAADLCNLKIQGRKHDALARLGELYDLRDALLEQLRLAKQNQQ